MALGGFRFWEWLHQVVRGSCLLFRTWEIFGEFFGEFFFFFSTNQIVTVPIVDTVEDLPFIRDDLCFFFFEQ